MVSQLETKLDIEIQSNLHPMYLSTSSVTGYVEAGFDGDLLAPVPAPTMHVEVPVMKLHSGRTIQDREMWRIVEPQRFPMIAADLRSIEPLGQGTRYKALGAITFVGRQRPFAGTLSVSSLPRRVIVEGELCVDISDFGLQPPNFGIFQILPEVNVRLRLVAAEN